MQNFEGRDSGALQHKVWNLGSLYPIRNDDRKDQGQLQTKVLDLGRQILKVHDQEVMNYFYFGILMQGHFLSTKILKFESSLKS